MTGVWTLAVPPARASVLSYSVVSYALWPHGLQPTRFLCLWDFPGKNTGVGCHFLLQGIFPTQGWSPCLPCLLQYRQILTTESMGTISLLSVSINLILSGDFIWMESYRTWSCVWLLSLSVMFLRFIHVVAVGLLYLWVPHPWIQPTTELNIFEKKFLKVPKSKTWIYSTLTTIYNNTFTLYLWLFTLY